MSSKKALRRLYSVMADISLPRGGGDTKTATVTGYVSFGEDMRHVLPKINALIRDLASHETYPGSIEEGLTELETWIANRKDQNWDFDHAGYRHVSSKLSSDTEGR